MDITSSVELDQASDVHILGIGFVTKCLYLKRSFRGKFRPRFFKNDSPMYIYIYTYTYIYIYMHICMYMHALRNLGMHTKMRVYLLAQVSWEDLQTKDEQKLALGP